MSQLSSQSQDPSGVCLPLGKYSYILGRDVAGAGKLPWNHIIRNDLNVHIRNVRTVDDQGNYITRVVMMVTAGADVLETQDLGDVRACYKRFDASFGGENPVRIVIRPPTYLAMVYPKPGANVQRLQLKLLSQTDFETIVNIFHNLGFATKESVAPVTGSLIPPRTNTSSAPPLSIYSAISGSSLTSTVARPASAMRNSPLSREISFDLTPSFKLPPIPEVSKSDTHRQFSNLAFSQPYNPALSALSTSMASRIESLEHRQDLNKHSSLYLAQMNNEATLERPPLPDPTVFESSDMGRHRDLSLVLSNERLNLERQMGKENPGHVTRSPFFDAKPEVIPDQRSSSSDPFARLRQETDDVFTSPPTVIRPTSAPVDKGAMQDLLIPPKRTLPFLPSKSRASSIADLPPLPKPTPVVRSESVIRPPILPGMTLPKASEKTGVKRVAQRKGPVQPATDKPLISSATSALDGGSLVSEPFPTSSQGEVSPLATKSATKRPQSAAAVLQTKATSTKKRAAPSRPASAAKRPKMIDQSTQTEPGFNKAAQTPENTRTPGSLISPPEEYLEAIDNFVTNHRARPPPNEIYNTPEYQDASPEEREILVNNFICENLQNPNFVQLCKDASNSWRRIGLGM